MNVFSLGAAECRYGELTCWVIDTPYLDLTQDEPDAPARGPSIAAAGSGRRSIRALVILCHGFGAPGDDLVPLAQEIFAQQPRCLGGVRFVFPIAPIQLEPSGFYDSRAWWPIDMGLLQQMMQRGELRDLRADRPGLLEQRYQQINSLIDQALAEAELDDEQLILGGFSQGSMLMTETALRRENPPSALLVWSGTLLSEPKWREFAGQRGQLTVLQTHGRDDPILPYHGAELLHEMFVEFGFQAEFHPFMGPHTISRESLSKTADLIANCAAGTLT